MHYSKYMSYSCYFICISFVKKFTNLDVYQHKNTLIKRLVNDPDVKRNIMNNFKSHYQRNDSRINDLNLDINELRVAPNKIQNLVDKINGLAKQYNKDKNDLDKLILHKFDLSANNSNFNSKNAELKRKIELYQENIELLKKGSNSNIKILKNHFTNKRIIYTKSY